MNVENLSDKLLAWYDRHGRHDLPWQRPRSPYRVWVSEIMLQQTQVSTVLPYFERFMQRFPDVLSLANAAQDDVLHLWTGLGYYARARNLHKAAQQIRDQHDGQFPQAFDEVVALPGIGRSTAGAILAQACEQRHPILDGNVKRVLTRLYAIEGWPGIKSVENRLWQYADQHTPRTRLADYTQAIMDLGATVCRRSQPRCDGCPLQADCQAYQSGTPSAFPHSKPRKAMPVRQTRMLILRDEKGQVLLQQRPPAGIWGSLWSFPECPAETDVQTWCAEHLDLALDKIKPAPAFRHTFSHFHLDITPVHAQVRPLGQSAMEPSKIVWYNTRLPNARGLPAPVKALLDKLEG